MEFWLLSLPLDKTSVASLEKLKRTIAKTNLATCGKLSIPELKVWFFHFLHLFILLQMLFIHYVYLFTILLQM